MSKAKESMRALVAESELFWRTDGFNRGVMKAARLLEGEGASIEFVKRVRELKRVQKATRTIAVTR